MNGAFAERATGYSGIYSIQTAVVNVTKDGVSFTCAMDKSKAMVYEHEIGSSSKPYTLTPYDGENPYAESEGWHQGASTSAERDTVTINHYMAGVAEQ